MAKTELLVVPATPIHHNFTIQLSTIFPSSLVRNLGLILDDQMTLKDYITRTHDHIAILELSVVMQYISIRKGVK